MAFFIVVLMEARVGIEPTDKGFADLSLSHLGTAPNAQYIETSPVLQTESQVTAEISGFGTGSKDPPRERK